MRVSSVPNRTRSFSAWVDVVRAIIWRMRDRHNRAASIGLFLTVCLITGSLAVIPRLVTQITNKGVIAAVDDSIRAQPGLSLGLKATLPGTSSDPMAAVVDDGQHFQSGLAPSIQDVVTGSSYVVESQRFNLINPLGPGKTSRYFRTFLTLRYQSGLDRPGLSTLVNGDLPKTIPPVSPDVFQGQAGNIGDQPLPAFQIALDETTAQALKLTVGDQVILQPDSSDPKTLAVPAAYLNYTLVGQISGIFKPVQENDRYWREDNSLLQPTVLDDGTTTTVYSYGLITPAAYPALLSQTSPVNWAYTWRYEVDPNRVNAGNNETLEQSIRSLLLTHGSAAALSTDPAAVSLKSPLVAALQQFRDQRDFLISAVILATLGVIAVAVSLLVLISMLVVEREASGTMLLRGRGADDRQLLGAQLTQTALIVLPAVIIGYVVALTVIPVKSTWIDLLVAGVTGLLAIGLTILAALPGARTPLGRLLNEQRSLGRDAGRTSSRWERRVALEAVVVLLAATGIYLVRRRGLLQSESGGIDPYLALIPFLAGLAVGILVLRLYPIPVRIVNRIVQRRRGIVVWAGLGRVVHQRASAQLPTLALLVAVGVAVFSLVVQHSLAVAQDAAVWQTVGADYRIDAPAGGALAESLNVEAISGVEAVARTYFLPGAYISDGDTSVNVVSFLAIDPADYQNVTQGTPAAVLIPEALTRPPTGQSFGTRANPLPAIASSGWSGGIKVGQDLQVTLESVPYWVRVTATMANFPSLPTDTPFIITSRSWLQAANPNVGSSVPVTRLFVRGSGSDVTSQLRQLLQQQTPSAVLSTRASALATTSHQLLAGGVTDVFRYSVVLVTLFAAAAGSVALMLASTERRRDLSYLRTLGLSSRQALGITVIEQLPPLISAAVAGAGLGVVVARLISPALDLSAFAGRAGVASGIVIDWWQITALTGGISLFVLAAIIGFGFLSRHLNLASALRLGDG